jgi:hypothetical protein
VRGPKSAPVEGEHELFGFLTTEANAIVAPIHPKAMPVILTTTEEFDLWLEGENRNVWYGPAPGGRLPGTGHWAGRGNYRRECRRVPQSWRPLNHAVLCQRGQLPDLLRRAIRREPDWTRTVVDVDGANLTEAIHPRSLRSQEHRSRR